MDGNPFTVPNVSYRAWLRGAVIPDLQVTASRALAGPLLRQNRRPVHQHEGSLSFVSSLIGQRTHAESDPARDGVPEESPIQVGRGLPLVGWKRLASMRTTGRGCCH
jgi:hypothetical protein